LALFLNNLVYATETIGEIQIDMKLDLGDWIGIQSFSTPSKCLQFEEEDGFVFGYDQPLIINSIGVVVNPTIQTIDTANCVVLEPPILIDIIALPSSLNFGSELTLDASSTDLSKI
jgi:hypothetical protein